MRSALLAAALLLGPAAAAHAAPLGSDWTPPAALTAIDGAQAMQWVASHNKRTLDVLQADPLYKPLYDTALAVAQAHDRIPAPAQLGGAITNFWQDEAHVRGLWRKATPASYRSATPAWTTLLDLDALARAEGANWVWKGSDCPEPAEQRCLLALSDGGEDAVTLREFDLRTMRFVSGGFALPRSKQDVAWVDDDTLLVARDWGPGSMTPSSYAFIVKALKRGQPLAQAREVYRGQPTDMEVMPTTLVDGQGHRVTLITRAISFFDSEIHLVTPHGLVRLDLPAQVLVKGLLDGRLILQINEDWTPKIGAPVPAGSVVALDPAHPDAAPETIFAPSPTQSLDDAGVTASSVVAAIYDNVRGQGWVFTPGAHGWAAHRLPLPDNVSVALADSTIHGETAFFDVTGFLTPTELWQADARKGSAEKIKSLPPKFDAAPFLVEQHQAVSTDGTKIPYFVVRRKDIAFDGRNPTLLYAYGGFNASMTPAYSGTLGKLWLARGGVYVLANIRGGGEFGPRWHDAGLKTKRQHIYDDFAAVAHDLVARKLTSPDRLGIRGGSNGGLLMGVEFTQHPELWKAVIIDVPLLDMMHYETLSAGASWVGEYGSVHVPAERAFLRSISPLENLKPGVAYPVPFIFTTTKDDRVGPVHARRFAAKMEAMGLPFYYFEQTEGGHAAGANLREAAEEAALEYTYLSRTLMK